MSYCRWSECDVYAYDSCEGGVRFFVAGDDSLNRLCGTYNEAYQYAKELRGKHGIDVPSYAIEALKADALEDAIRRFGPHSAVAELKAENAKLRELVNGMWYCANEAYGMCARVPVGGERPFTCCPLYDFDAKEYRCEKLMQELGIEVDE